MRTSFHHQPEAQHPNFPQAGRPITHLLADFVAEVPGTALRELRREALSAHLFPRLALNAAETDPP